MDNEKSVHVKHFMLFPGEKFRYGETFGHSTKNALVNRPAAVKPVVTVNNAATATAVA